MTPDEKVAFLPLDKLRLDPDNPRLPEELDISDEDGLLKFIEENYDAITNRYGAPRGTIGQARGRNR